MSSPSLSLVRARPLVFTQSSRKCTFLADRVETIIFRNYASIDFYHRIRLIRFHELKLNFNRIKISLRENNYTSRRAAKRSRNWPIYGTIIKNNRNKIFISPVSTIIYKLHLRLFQIPTSLPYFLFLSPLHTEFYIFTILLLTRRCCQQCHGIGNFA